MIDKVYLTCCIMSVSLMQAAHSKIDRLIKEFRKIRLSNKEKIRILSWVNKDENRNCQMKKLFFLNQKLFIYVSKKPKKFEQSTKKIQKFLSRNTFQLFF